MIKLDARDLPSPEPFQIAVSALSRLEVGEIIHFKHRMVPQLLMPRLSEYYYKMIEGDEVDIYICHKDDETSIREIERLVR